MLANLWTSIVRTFIPWLVGLLVGWLLTLGIAVPTELTESISLLAAFAFAAVYYLVARWAERKGIRWLQWMLGKPTPPVYGEHPDIDTPTQELAKAITQAGLDATQVLALLDSREKTTPDDGKAP